MKKEHFEVLMEDQNAKLDAVLELVADVPEIKIGFAWLKTRVQTLTDDMVIVKDALRIHGREIHHVKSDISGIKGDISILKADVADIKEDIVEIRGDVIEIKEDIVDIRGDIVEIKGDIAILKGDVAGLQQQFA